MGLLVCSFRFQFSAATIKRVWVGRFCLFFNYLLFWSDTIQSSDPYTYVYIHQKQKPKLFWDRRSVTFKIKSYSQWTNANSSKSNQNNKYLTFNLYTQYIYRLPFILSLPYLSILNTIKYFSPYSLTIIIYKFLISWNYCAVFPK